MIPLLLLVLGLLAALGVCMLFFGFSLYRALLKRTKAAAREDDSIVTYPLA